MNIRIDDDVPLPEPSKPDTWVSVSTPTTKRDDGGWVKAAFLDPAIESNCGPIGGLSGKVTVEPRKAGPVEKPKAKAWELPPQRYPAETTYDAKGQPITDCFLVGGPLNGRHGPIVGTAQVVELDIYAAGGSVASVELYELGDRKELGCRYWKGTKEYCVECRKSFEVGIVRDSGHCDECWSKVTGT